MKQRRVTVRQSSGGHTGRYHGITLGSSVQEHFGLWSMYRFPIEDPVRFTTSLKVSIGHRHANDQGNGYSSVAYWYQTGKHADYERTASRGGPAGPRLARAWALGRINRSQA